MNFLAGFFYRFRRIWKAVKLFLAVAGPGIIVMVADNDAGSITTHPIIGSGFGHRLVPNLLSPVDYVAREIVVRRSSVIRRGYTEAVFNSSWFEYEVVG
jgi:Mn2+/Fe2+ NRAMP family transporter